MICDACCLMTVAMLLSVTDVSKGETEGERGAMEGTAQAEDGVDSRAEPVALKTETSLVPRLSWRIFNYAGVAIATPAFQHPRIIKSPPESLGTRLD